jgi:chemotaxis protein histidine kinase CheA
MDAQTKELVQGFIEESSEIIEGVLEPLSELEAGEGSAEKFAAMAGKIDAIMGCAKTLGVGNLKEIAPALQTISNLSEGAKALGYSASLLKQPELITLVAAFLSEAVEMIQTALEDLAENKSSVDTAQADRIRERLIWLSEKLKLAPKDQSELLTRFGLKA